MNHNKIFTNCFSNKYTANKYEKQLDRDDYGCLPQCGGCSFYGELNAGYGVCCYEKSEYHLETVFEHFRCDKIVEEGWSYHSFDENLVVHCTTEDLIRYLIEAEIALNSFRKKRPYNNVKKFHLQLRYYIEKKNLKLKVLG